MHNVCEIGLKNRQRFSLRMGRAHSHNTRCRFSRCIPLSRTRNKLNRNKEQKKSTGNFSTNKIQCDCTVKLCLISYFFARAKNTRKKINPKKNYRKATGYRRDDASTYGIYVYYNVLMAQRSAATAGGYREKRTVELRFFDGKKNAAAHNNNSAHNRSVNSWARRDETATATSVERALRAQSESKKKPTQRKTKSDQN